jgi:hypothetical protein
MPDLQQTQPAGPTPQPAARGKTRRWRRRLMAAVGVLLVLYVVAYLFCRDRHGDVLEVTVGPFAGHALAVPFAPLMWCDDQLRDALREDAEHVVASACARARAQDKRVMLILCTRNCLPCRQLHRFLAENAALVAKYYVIADVDLEEMRHAQELNDRFRPPAEGHINYIPWVGILDGDGTALFTAGEIDDPIPLPFAADRDRDCFLEMLRKTARGITPEECAALDQAAQAFRRQVNSE